MTAHIEKQYFFNAAIHFENNFMINNYELTLYMAVETDCIREQHVGIDRLNYMIYNQFEDSIFIAKEHEECIENYERAGLHVLIIPEEPYDQIVGMIILQKLNAVLDGKIKITDISFGSKVNHGIKFCVPSEHSEEVFSGKHWWNNGSTSIRDDHKKEKIVNLFNDDDWAKLELSWKEKPNTAPKLIDSE